ncbi:hypothetical protein MRX96_038450 [Rhipicephalus microplus]
MRVMGSPIKSAQLRAAVAPSIFVNEQNASEAPKAHLLKRPKDQILGCLLFGGTTILHTSKPNHSSEIDQDDVVTEEVLKVAPDNILERPKEVRGGGGDGERFLNLVCF